MEQRRAFPLSEFFFAPVALSRFRTVIVHTNDRWNPARGRLYSGAALALLSLLAHAIGAVVIYIQIVHRYYDA